MIYALDVEAEAAFWELLGFRRHVQLPAEGAPGYVGLRVEDGPELAVTHAQWAADRYGMELGSGPRFEMYVYVDELDQTVGRLRAAGVRQRPPAGDIRASMPAGAPGVPAGRRSPGRHRRWRRCGAPRARCGDCATTNSDSKAPYSGAKSASRSSTIAGTRSSTRSRRTVRRPTRQRDGDDPRCRRTASRSAPHVGHPAAKGCIFWPQPGQRSAFETTGER